jgi:polyisoprenoid-binding protein YceI
MKKTRNLVIGLLAVVGLAVVGVFGWILFIRDDAPEALSTSDLDDALGATTVPAVAPATEPPATSAGASPEATADPATTAATGGGGSPGEVSGTWAVAAADSTLGYRVQEVLGGVDTEGAGRTSDVTGSLTIDGTQATAAEFTVQMASITSDSDRRDGQFRTRIMSTDDVPTATFVLTSPIDFGAVPAEGVDVPATATGDLTLRGVTNSVTFDLTARLEGGRIGVLGSIPILFSDYEIPDPSNGFAVVKDNGLLEFVLVFDPA